MRKELDRIIENLDTVYRGDAWHGPSISEILNSLKPEVVDQKHGFSKRTISELIYHLIAWRLFAIQKLKDNIHFTLGTEEANWGSADLTSKESWSKLKQLFIDTQKEFIALLERQDDTLLDKRVPGEYYDYHKLLTGIIQHDTYHLGMIWVLWE